MSLSVLAASLTDLTSLLLDVFARPYFLTLFKSPLKCNFFASEDNNASLCFKEYYIVFPVAFLDSLSHLTLI